MSLQGLRLSISGCALSTAAAWAVEHTLRDWYGLSALEEEAAKLSPYWIPLRAACHMEKLEMKRKSVKKVGTAEEVKVYRKQAHKPSQVVSVFGTNYVNAVDTNVCYMIDSATCAKLALPVDEAGEILWALVAFSHARDVDLLEGKTLGNFGSPYWVEGNEIYARWGVKPQSNAKPFCLQNGLHFINAEQTTDASIFDSLSCAPQRRHQCITVNGLMLINWDFSKKLNEWRSEMKNKSLNDDTAMGSQKCSSNLWVDVKLIEALQWTLHDGAVGVEVPSQATAQDILSPNEPKTDTKKDSLVIVHADFVVERDALVNLIRYKPQYVGLKKGMFAPYFTVVRLSFIASMKKYTSNTWITPEVVEEESLRGKNKSEFTGVEVNMIRKGAAQFKCILINLDELDISSAQVDELNVRYEQSLSHI